MGRLLGRVWVGFTTLLISFIAYTSQIFLSMPLLAALVPFNILLGLLFWNYFSTVRTDPGGVPKNWEPDTRTDVGYEVKKLTGRPRYCRTCKEFKPPRAHHCQQCRRPWVNNCVGHYNYAHFIRFLILVDICCTYHLVMMSKRALAAIDPINYLDEPGSTELVFLVLNFCFCIPVILCVGIFSLYHFYCVANNTTTIEGWEKDKVATLVRKGKIREHLGTLQNVRYILGSSPLGFLLPTTPVTGTGLHYPVASGSGKWIEFHNHESPRAESPREDEPNQSDIGQKHTRQQKQFKLPESPWTYGNGLNPTLRPSNTTRLRANATRQPENPVDPISPLHISNVPPYHASFQSEGEFGPDVDPPDNSSQISVRLGSEGWEARPATTVDPGARWDVGAWREGIASPPEPERYNWYVPNEDTTSEEEEEDIDEENDVWQPVAKRAKI
ncbi:hypothetical protein BS47DRAFT_1371685 [Hydnum rufescens UP504]|uniref:Palmitoyltransferase n=1 Tax=Hydnum rufescens UP504 TaxID=1448309 RepID=A0A9P6B2L0_9AGAM|nr:hypothetical protein BS47DRAFT_1371685 [Hydnum rufescens UP504]